MQSLEKNLWGTFKTNLDKHRGTRAHYQRIETGGTGLGIPDVNIKVDGCEETWIELKVVQGLRVELRPEQVVWHVRRARSGGSSWVLAREKKNGPRVGTVDRLYVWPGRVAQEIAAQGVACPGAAVFNAPFDWGAVLLAMGL
jgi:hypothetical protein